MKRGKLVFIGVNVPRTIKERVDDAVRRGLYVNQSEAIRAALREKFEEAEA